jgi:hypothetical protein
LPPHTQWGALEQCSLTLTRASYEPLSPQLTKVQYYNKIQLDESSGVDENSVVDISSLKLVDESSVLVENTSLKLDEKAVVYQSVFSLLRTILIFLETPIALLTQNCNEMLIFISL